MHITKLKSRILKIRDPCKRLTTKIAIYIFVFKLTMVLPFEIDGKATIICIKKATKKIKWIEWLLNK